MMDLHPIWCGLHIKHPAAKDNMLIDRQHKGKSFNIWVNSQLRRIYCSFGSSQTNDPNGKILLSPLLSALISATTLKSAMVFAVHGTLFKPSLLHGIASKSWNT